MLEILQWLEGTLNKVTKHVAARGWSDEDFSNSVV